MLHDIVSNWRNHHVVRSLGRYSLKLPSFIPETFCKNGGMVIIINTFFYLFPVELDVTGTGFQVMEVLPSFVNVLFVFNERPSLRWVRNGRHSNWFKRDPLTDTYWGWRMNPSYEHQVNMFIWLINVETTLTDGLQKNSEAPIGTRM